MKTNMICCLIVAAAGAFAASATVHADTYPDTPTRLWPGGIIPYQFSPTDPPPAGSQCVILAAMNTWSAVANVTFVVRTNEADFLSIVNAADGNGPRYPPPSGYRAGTGGHTLVIDNWGSNPASCTSCTAVLGIAHELGHVLGLYHTQQRADRDNYMVVHFDAIIDSAEGNFNTANDAQYWPRTAPDFDSIMSYPVCVFSTCAAACANDPDGPCAAITLLEPYATQYAGALTCPTQCPPPVVCMGQRNHLSDFDKLLMQFLYPPSNWRFVERNPTFGSGDGTFHEPFVTLGEAETDVPTGGTVWFLKAGTFVEPGVHNKAMTMRAPLGGAIVRAN